MSRTSRAQRPPPSKEMATRIDIAKRGDVLLELGRDGETTAVVAVSTAVLSLASPVFEAMFNGRFAEGQGLSTTAPRAVPLPDDDQDSMLLICKIAHLQTAELPQQLSVNQLSVFAITCDKHQCGAAVQAWSQVWIAKLLSDEPAANFEKMVFATYVLGMPLEFYKACTILTRTEEEDTKIFALDYLPSTIFDALRSNRRRGEMQLYQSFHRATQYPGLVKHLVEDWARSLSILRKLAYGQSHQRLSNALKTRLPSSWMRSWDTLATEDT